MIPRLYVVGGHAKEKAQQKPGEHRYQNGLIILIDPEAGKADQCVEYVSPPEACASDQDPSVLFKAGTLDGDRLFVCTQTEILVYQVPGFRLENYISLPHFNDIHHVRPSNEGRLLVANTGLDMVLEIALDGFVHSEWDVLGDTPWSRFTRNVDYRKVVSTQPHQAHPNFVFLNDDEIWVTRFEQRDAVCLNKDGRRIPIQHQAPHDGIVFRKKVYFTTVDGHVVKADLGTGQVERLVDLNELSPTNDALGWCRGLEVIDDDLVVVGFSRLRPTQWQRNLSWLRKGVGRPGVLPARVALYDLARPALHWEHIVESSGLDAVFSIHIAEISP